MNQTVLVSGRWIMLSARLKEETGSCVKHQNKTVFMPFSCIQ